MEAYLLRLYVMGRTARAERAVTNLQRLCDELLPSNARIEVIDVLERPEVAEEDRVLATPTLVRVLPPPARRIIGDLSNRDRVLEALELYPNRRAQDPLG